MVKVGAKRPPNEREVAVLEELAAELRGYTDADEPLLRELWALGVGPSVAFERTSEAWTTDLGFQQADPISDVRGGGVLALRQLVGFLQREPNYARALMASRKLDAGAFDPTAPGYYPFACAGINVTRLVADLVGLSGGGSSADKVAAARKLELSYWPVVVAGSRGGALLVDCYATAFRVVDRQFDHRDASYMDFNTVLKEAGLMMRRALEHAAVQDDVCRALKLAPAVWGASAPLVGAPLDKLPVSGMLNTAKLVKLKRRFFIVRGDVLAWFKPSDRAFTDDWALDDAALWVKAEVHGELASFVRLTAASTVKYHKSDSTSFKISHCTTPTPTGLPGGLCKVRLRALDAARAAEWIGAVERTIGVLKQGGADIDHIDIHPIHGDEDDDEEDRPHQRRRSSSSRLGDGLVRKNVEKEEDHSRPPWAPDERPRGLEEDDAAAATTTTTTRLEDEASPRPPAVEADGRQSYKDVIPPSPAAAATGDGGGDDEDDALTLLPPTASTVSDRQKTTSGKFLAAARSLIIPRRRASAFSQKKQFWLACTDEERSRVYFVERTSGTVQWDLPPGWTSHLSGWSARVDPASGHVFYFHPRTGETAWHLPERRRA